MPRPKAGESNAELIRYALAGIDAEIKELQEKRAELLSRVSPAPAAAPPAAKKRRGRRPGSKKAAKTGAKKAARKTAAASTPRKRKFSAETRKKLSEAAQARWAKARAAKKAE